MASLNLSSLSKYTDQLSQPIIAEAVLRSRTMDLVTVLQGVKYKTQLNLMSQTLIGVASNCIGATTSGSTSLTAKDLTVCPITVNESICIDELEQYWMGAKAKAGSSNTDAPDAFVEPFVKFKSDGISNMIEQILWAGNTNSTGATGNAALCNGYFQKLDNTSYSGSSVNVTKTAMTTSNAISIMDNFIIPQIPTDIIADDKLVLFCGFDTFTTLATASRIANNYIYNPASNFNDRTFIMPYLNTNVMVVGLKYITGGKMLLTPSWNLVAGTDLKDDADMFKLFYSERDDLIFFRSKFKVGAEIYFPQYVVYYR